jgi:ornithine carbamoyltransferase
MKKMINHFIDIDDFNKLELRKILKFAKKIKNNPRKYSSLLKHKSLGLMFQKKSTRTRLSFSIGMQKLGGHVIELDTNQIGFDTRESKEDVIKVMSQYLDILMIRNDDHQQLIELASLNTLPIINGLSNYSHPCQILSDIFTIEECLGAIEKKTIAWIGDFNNVLISLIHAAEIFRFKLNVLAPSLMSKKEKKILNKKKLIYTCFIKDIPLGLKNVDCVMTDVWVSMGEKNNKKKKQILKKFQVNDKIMQLAKKNAIFMHCLPAHRNEEVTDYVIDSKKSVVWQQAKNRLYVQQSILNYLINDV